MNKSIKKHPKALYIELTSSCNLLCSMCRDRSYKGFTMPISLFTEISKVLFNHAKFVDLRGNGESTTLPNFKDYLDIALQYPLKKKLISNGAVEKSGLWEYLGENDIMIGFSIDASSPSLFKKLRGGANLEIVKQNIIKFVKHSSNPVENSYFCSTVSSLNIEELSDLIYLGINLGIRWFKFSPITTSDNDPMSLVHCKDKIYSAIPALEIISAEEGVKIEFNASLLPELAIKEKTDKLCIHPFDYAYINSKGNIGFCDHLNGLEQFTYGNWKEGFDSVWNGKTMSRLREEHLDKMANGKPVKACEECNWCYENRYIDLEYTIDSKFLNYIVVL